MIIFEKGKIRKNNLGRNVIGKAILEMVYYCT
jgi:hypothetical protein